MKTVASAVAAILVIGAFAAGDALAAKPDRKAGKNDGTTGTITKIEGRAPAVTLTVSAGHGKKAKETTVTTDDKTSVTVDGQTKSVADLKVGGHVKLSAATGTMKSVEASTPAPEEKKGKKKGKKKKDA